MSESGPASPHSPLIEITDPDQDRYARMRLIAGYDQTLMARSRVMVVGAGALGNEVLKNLALLGVGQVVIIDFDTIETHNLTRSLLFRAEDRGRPKAVVAAERVRQINPDVSVIALCANVEHDAGLGTFGQMDVVFGCLDNRAARLAVNRACWRMGVPWVDGALDAGDGSVRVFVPPEGACYECLMTRRDYALAQVRYACPPAAAMDAVSLTTPISASIIGAMQVQEALKLLHGQRSAGGWGVVYAGDTLRTTTLTYTRREDCPVHSPQSAIIAHACALEGLTVGCLLDLVAGDLGNRAQIVLPDQLVTSCYCPVCDVAEVVYRPFRVVVPARLACTTCGADRIFDVTGVVAAHDTTADLALAQLGFSPYAVVEVRAGRQRMAVELVGDHDRVLPGWERKEQDAR